MTRRHSRFPAVNRDIAPGGVAVVSPPKAAAPTAPPPPPAPEPEPVEVEEAEVEEFEVEEFEDIEFEDADEPEDEDDDDKGYTSVGGGWYELADGRRIQGLDNVHAALEEGDSPTDD